MNHPIRWRLGALASAVALLGSASSFDAAAMALGRITVQSALGEPLRAEIDIADINSDEAATLKAGPASAEAFRAAGMEYTNSILDLQVSLQRRADGRAFLRLSSSRPVTEPFVDLVLEANWSSGRITRDYTMLFDPPALRGSAVAGLATPSAPSVSAAPARPPATPSVTPSAVASAAPQPMPVARAAVVPPVARAASTAKPANNGQVTVKAGDTAGKIAADNKPASVSLDQMLVAMLRGNPDAFVDGNVNRIKSGAVLDIPSAEAASAVSAAEASSTIVAQSKNFNDFRRKLAQSVPDAQVGSATRQAAGQVQAKVEDRAAQAVAPDKLTLSKGAVQGKSAAEEKIAKDRQAREASERVAELSKNIGDLNKLTGTPPAITPSTAVRSTASSAAMPASGQPAAAQPARAGAGGLAVPKAPLTAPAAPNVAAPSTSTGIGSASPAVSSTLAGLATSQPATTPTATNSAASAAAVTSTSSITGAGSATVPATATGTLPTVADAAVGSVATDTITTAALVPGATLPDTASVSSTEASAAVATPGSPVKAADAAPAQQPASFLDELTENPFVIPGLGALLLLLGGLGFYRYRQRNTAQVDSSFLESRLQPDSFFGASGGQRIDTNEGSATGSSLMYSPSQLDAAGDVDPVAEADVYLAYGRDLQAEEILKEALRTNPARVAIHAKLAEIYAKRRDVKAFEVMALETFNLTHGQGPEWAYISEVGRELDPSNLMYQPGGQPGTVGARETNSVSDSGGFGASTMPMPHMGLAEKPGSGMGESVDLDLDFSLDDAPLVASPAVQAAPVRASASVPQQSPVAAAKPADDLGFNGLDMDFGNEVVATKPVVQPSKAVLAETSNSVASVTSAAASHDAGLSFDMDFSPSPAVAAKPAAAAAPAPADDGMLAFDMDSLSLDLDQHNNASSVATAPVALAEPAAAAATSPLETKFALAEEFRALGDMDGARSLAEEVLAEAQGPLKAKAQAFLNALS